MLAAVLAVARWTQRIIAVDDAYISFRYGKNLADGLGLVFNEGVRIEGYTNFAWTLLSAAAIGLGVDPLLAARVVGVSCYALIAATLVFLWFKWTESDAFRWLGLPVLWLLFARTGFAAHAGTGLETMAAALLMLSVGVTAFALAAPMWVSACLAALLCLVRADGALVVAVVALVLLHQGKRRDGHWELRKAARWAAIPMATVLLHTVFRLAYYGQLLPNTYFAKAGGIYAWVRGASYLGTVLYALPELFVVVAAIVGGLVFARDRTRWVIRYGALFGLVYAVHIMHAGGDFMEYRFLWTVYPVLLFAGFAGLIDIAARKRAVAVAGVLLAVGLTFAQRPTETDSFGFPRIVKDGFGFQSLEVMNLMVEEGTLVGSKLEEVIPPDTVIATTLAGTVPYFSGLPTVDQWGLNEPYVRSVGASPGYPRGHVKKASDEYLEERGVELRLDHPMLCSCRRPRREKGERNVFVRLGGDRCVRARYVHTTPQLTKHFCEHPEWFVLRGVACVREPAASGDGD